MYEQDKFCARVEHEKSFITLRPDFIDANKKAQILTVSWRVKKLSSFSINFLTNEKLPMSNKCFHGKVQKLSSFFCRKNILAMAMYRMCIYFPQQFPSIYFVLLSEEKKPVS